MKTLKDQVMSDKTSNRLLKTGVMGSAIAAICCFTPVLTVILVAMGLGAITGYLDYVLFPALAVFVGITIYTVVRRRSSICDETCVPGQPKHK